MSLCVNLSLFHFRINEFKSFAWKIATTILSFDSQTKQHRKIVYMTKNIRNRWWIIVTIFSSLWYSFVFIRNEWIMNDVDGHWMQRSFLLLSIQSRFKLVLKKKNAVKIIHSVYSHAFFKTGKKKNSEQFGYLVDHLIFLNDFDKYLRLFRLQFLIKLKWTYDSYYENATRQCNYQYVAQLRL